MKIKLKKFLSFVDKNFKKIFLIINFLLFTTYLVPEFISEFKKPFTYKEHGLVNPESMEHVPIEAGNSFTHTFTPKLNHLGSFYLYFKPIDYTDCKKIESYKEPLEPDFDEDDFEINQNTSQQFIDEETNLNIYPDDWVILNNEKPIPLICEQNNRFSLLISVTNETDGEEILNSSFEIYHDKPTAISYPFGFPNQEDSKGKTYTIKITPEADGTKDPSFMGIAVENGKPLISANSHIPLNKITQNLSDSIYILIFKIVNIGYRVALPFLLLGINFGIIFKKKKISNNLLFWLFVVNLVVSNYISFFAMNSTARGLTFLAYTAAIGSLIKTTKPWEKNKLFRDLNLEQKPSKKIESPNSKKYFIIFTIIFLVGLFLRLYRLDFLDPSTDEYSHLIAAKDLIEGASLDEIYQRSKYNVTLPISLAFRIFGPNVFVARSVGAIANMLAVFPLYFIGKKINKKFSLIVVILYSLNPLMIAMSREIREYAFLPLYYYLIILIMLNFIEKLIQNKNSKAMLTGVILFLPAFYLYRFDHSTYRIIVLTYLSFIIFLIAFNKFIKNNKFRFLVIAASLMGLVAIIYLINQTKYFNLKPFFSWNLSALFLDNNHQEQWHYGFNPLIPLAASLVTLLYFLKSNGNLLIKFIITNFFVHLYLFTYHFSYFKRVRYALVAQNAYILFLGVGIYILYRIIKVRHKNIHPQIVLIILFMLTINPAIPLKPALNKNPTNAPIIDYYHDVMDNTFSYINENIQKNDVLMGTVYIWYHIWNNGIPPREIIHYQYTDQDRFNKINDLVLTYDHGWIVIDDRRNSELGKGLPESDFLVKDKKISYSKIDTNNIYKW